MKLLQLVRGDMGVTQFPKGMTLPEKVTCVICRKFISLTGATAGLHDAEGNLAFACEGHFWSMSRLIVGWADFMALERSKRLRNGRATAYEEVLGGRSIR
jgi:hypothetical protein